MYFGVGEERNEETLSDGWVMLLPSSSLSASLSLFRALFLAPQPRFDTALKEKHRSPLQGPVEHGEDERPPEQEEPHFGSGWGRERASERSLTSREFVPQWSVEVFIFFPFALPVPQFPLFPLRNDPFLVSFLRQTQSKRRTRVPFLFLRQAPTKQTQKCSPPWLPPAAAPSPLPARPPPPAAARPRTSRPRPAPACASRPLRPSPRPGPRSSSRECAECS